jgi:hypothetical protein
MLRFNIWPHLSNGDKVGWKKIYFTTPFNRRTLTLGGNEMFCKQFKKAKKCAKNGNVLDITGIVILLQCVKACK